MHKPMHKLMLSQNAIILVRPQMGENIGAAARAMANFGLTDLRIVAPRDGWPNPRAIDTAAGAFDYMPEPKVYESLSAACTGLHKIYATTARSRDMVKPVFTPEGAAGDAKAILQSQSAKAGFVFGPERTGLENEDIAHCHALINVPTNPDFSSLNLGQCVLLMCYTLAQGQYEEVCTLPTGDSAPVTYEKMEEFLTRLERELDTQQFFKSEGLKPTMMRNIRNIFMRGDLTDQEVKTLHGIVSALIR